MMLKDFVSYPIHGSPADSWGVLLTGAYLFVLASGLGVDMPLRMAEADTVQSAPFTQAAGSRSEELTWALLLIAPLIASL